MYASIIDALRQDGDISRVTDDSVREWITVSRDAIAAEAQREGRRLKDYACTLLGAVTGHESALFFQIGDGAIVIRAGEKYQAVFWPEQGEYANTTFFVSDETYRDRIRISRQNPPPEEVALFTDGLQNLVLSLSKKEAHAGFFRPLFEALRKDPGNGFSDFDGQLARFLEREDISARSDDDRTLVLAVQSPG
jgi:hypothetical protein